ncbi:MAG: hydantoinase B/oxoprolinase family protein [Chloroflexi bacterium]|nr:hydantoinase B/oxoprolinase family protein [Chloroflexota bacterium]
MANTLDPVTFEIIKHKFSSIIEEAVIALENVSGSPIAAEGHDLMIALYRPNGEMLMAGLGYLQHMTSAAQAVKHIVTTYSEDPGIFEGDVYFFNDPFAASAHTSDVFLISPIYWKGTHTGFVANFVHMTDIGAMEPGGFSPSATESYQEGFSSPGMKLVERGKVRVDILNTFLNQVREPGMVALDLKSQMAANYTAQARMQRLYDDYGFETVDIVAKELIDQSEQFLRQRLLELPDGRWRAREYFDMADHVYRVELTATKQEDSLTFDFTGTSEQSRTGINSSYWGTQGVTFSPVLSLLAHDISWNEGTLKPVKLIAPEGTLVNARHPAPISVSTVGIMQSVFNLSSMVIGKMLGASEKYKNRAMAVWSGSRAVVTLAGLNQSGQYTILHGAEALAGAGGARAFADGVDVGGDTKNVVSRLANVESQERRFPHIYLYRRIVPDSGGPGKYRGGTASECAVAAHGTPADTIKAVLFPGKGVACPHGQGLFGGYPGCHTAYIEFMGSNVADLPYSLDSTSATEVRHVSFGTVDLTRNDILYYRHTGGGGYGDPLDRDPELVLRDVLAGLVSRKAAEQSYGVVLNPRNRVDSQATSGRRLFMRKARLGDGHELRAGIARKPVAASGCRISEYLQVAGVSGKKFIQCTWCGARICGASMKWKENCSTRKSPVEIAGPLRESNGQFHLLEFFCPGCATLLDVDVVYREDDPIIDDIFGWPEEQTRDASFTAVRIMTS